MIKCVKTTPTYVLMKHGVRIYQIEGADLSHLEEKIRYFSSEHVNTTASQQAEQKRTSEVRKLVFKRESSTGNLISYVLPDLSLRKSLPSNGEVRIDTDGNMEFGKKKIVVKSLSITPDDDNENNIENVNDIKANNVTTTSRLTENKNVVTATHSPSGLLGAAQESIDSDFEDTFEEISIDEILQSETSTTDASLSFTDKTEIKQPECQGKKEPNISSEHIGSVVSKVVSAGNSNEPPITSVPSPQHPPRNANLISLLTNNVVSSTSSKPISQNSTQLKKATARKSTSKLPSTGPIYTKQVFETSEDTVVPRLPDSDKHMQYFSLSNRPPTDHSYNAGPNSVLPSFWDDTEDEKPAERLFVKFSPPKKKSKVLTERKKSSDDNSSIFKSTDVSMKSSEPKKSPIMSPQTCFVILSRDPAIDNIAANAAREKDVAKLGKRKRVDSEGTEDKSKKIRVDSEGDSSITRRAQCMLCRSYFVDTAKLREHMKDVHDYTSVVPKTPSKDESTPRPSRQPTSSSASRSRGESVESTDSSQREASPRVSSRSPRAQNSTQKAISRSESTESRASSVKDQPSSPPPMVETTGFPCSECDKVFSIHSNLRRHFAVAHKDAMESESSSLIMERQQYQCAECHYVFEERKNCYKHIWNVHKWNCGIQVVRGKEHFTKKQLEETHCYKCKRNFTATCYYRRHVRVVHRITSGILPEKPEILPESQQRVKCEKCQQMFANAANLRRHINNLHKVVEKPLEIENAKPPEPKPKILKRYECVKCKKQCNSQYNLESHQSAAHGRLFKPVLIKEEIPYHMDGLPQREAPNDSATEKPSPKPKEPILKLREPIRKPKGLISKPKEPVAKPKEPTAKTKELTPKTKELTPKTKELTPKTKELTPKTKELTPKTKELTPKTKELTPKTKELTPKTKELTPKTKEPTPKIKEPVRKPKELVQKPKATPPKPKESFYICKCGEKFKSFMRLMRHVSLNHNKSKDSDKDVSDADSLDKSDDELEKMSDDEGGGAAGAASSSDDMAITEQDKSDEEEEEDNVDRDPDYEDSSNNAENNTVLFTCDLCGLKFSSYNSLRRHEVTLHKTSIWKRLGISGKKCYKCSKVFSSEKSLRKHFNTAHMQQMMEDGELPGSYVLSRPQINCYLCQRKYHLYKNLMAHLRGHHKIKFNNIGHLRRYMESKKKPSKGDNSKSEDKSVSEGPTRDKISPQKPKNPPQIKSPKVNQKPQDQNDRPAQGSNSKPKGQLQCFKCDSTYSYYRTLIWHLKKIHNTRFENSRKLKAYMDKLAGKSAEPQDGSENDANTSKESQGNVRCQKCGRTYHILKSLRRHLKAIHKMSDEGVRKAMASAKLALKAKLTPAEACSTCDRLIKRMRLLRRHLNTDHKARLPGWKEDEPIAQAMFLREEVVKLKSLHGAEPCSECAQSKAIITCIKKHAAVCVASGKPLQNKPKASPSTLIVKTSSMGKKTGSSSATATKSVPSETSSESSRPPSVDFEFFCTACGQGFWRADSLLRHQNTLLPTKSRKCEKCGTCFRTCQALSSHGAAGCNTPTEDSDNEENPRYKCDVCKESFSMLDTLLRHFKSQHNKYSPHNCRFCTASFRTLHYLRHHIKRIHPEHNNIDTTISPSGEQMTESEKTPQPVTPIGEAWANKAVKTEPGLDNQPASSISVPQQNSENLVSVKAEPMDTGYEHSNLTPVPERNTAAATTTTAQNEAKPFLKKPSGGFQCNNCGSNFQKLKTLHQHQKAQHSNIRHHCPKCPAGFHTRIYLLYHCKKQHRITDPITQRPISQTPSKIKKSMFQKRETVTAPQTGSAPRFTCPMCSTGFRTFFYLGYHLEQFHGINDLDDQAYGDTSSKKTTKKPEAGTKATQSTVPPTPTKSALAIGKLRGGRYICNTCGSDFEHEKSLKGHYRQQHKKKSAYNCDMCGANFRSHRYLQFHKKKRHGPQVDDEQSVETTSSNTAHPPFTCQECGDKYSRERNLREHVKTQHVRINFRCEDCGVGYTTFYSYKQHCQKRHQRTVKPPEDSNDIQKEAFRCQLCKEQFKTIGEIRQHVRKNHNFSKPKFTCEKCGEKCMTHMYYRVHLRVFHNVRIDKEPLPGEGPNGETKCEICQLSFPESSYLQRHCIQQHSNPLFTCLLCHGAFERRLFVDMHLQKIHGVQEEHTGEYAIHLSGLQRLARRKQQSKGNLEEDESMETDEAIDQENDEAVESDEVIDPCGDWTEEEATASRFLEEPRDIEISVDDSQITEKTQQPYVNADMNSKPTASGSQQGDITSQQGTITSQQRHITSQQGVTTSQQRVTTSQQGVTTSQQREITSQQGDITFHQREITPQPREITSQQGAITSQQPEITPQPREITSEQGEITSQQGDITSQQGDITSHQREINSQGVRTSQQGPITSQQGEITSQSNISAPKTDHEMESSNCLGLKISSAVSLTSNEPVHIQMEKMDANVNQETKSAETNLQVENNHQENVEENSISKNAVCKITENKTLGSNAGEKGEIAEGNSATPSVNVSNQGALLADSDVEILEKNRQVTELIDLTLSDSESESNARTDPITGGVHIKQEVDLD